MDRESFRYYRWRMVFGGKLWALDADWYRMLGVLYLQDLWPSVVATDGEQIEGEFAFIPYGFTRWTSPVTMKQNSDDR